MVRSATAVLALAIFPGLMAGEEPVQQVSERATLEVVVRFDFDEAAITAETDQLLREKLPILRSSPDFTLRLEGHADERGSIEYNLALGSRRAESVRDFLTSQGISEDRLTTTSFGKERPLVDRSDPEAWAQNRRVEFVITGSPTVAVADDPAAAAADIAAAAAAAAAIAARDLARTEPAVVGNVDVTVVQARPEPVVRPVRDQSVRDSRSRFYRDVSAGSTVRTTEIADYLWVTPSSAWSAQWLGPMLLEDVEFDGRVETFIQEGAVRTAFPYTWVRLTLEPGFRPRLGDDLQIYRPDRVNRHEGVILDPMGVLRVTRVAPNAVEGMVRAAFGPVKLGDFVRPAPVFDLRPGEYPATVTNRTEAAVIEFGHSHAIYGLREVTILDKGSLDGVDIGDEYVAFFGDGSTEEIIGRLRVVLTEEETSSARIVTVEGPVFEVGTTVYLDRKMR
jgi:peptidoglycan-associated lipoprotein